MDNPYLNESKSQGRYTNYLLDLAEQWDDYENSRKKAEDVVEVYDEYYQFEDELVEDYMMKGKRDPGLGREFREMPTNEDNEEPVLVKLFEDSDDIPNDIVDFVHDQINSVVRYMMNMKPPSPPPTPPFMRNRASRHNSSTTGAMWIHELLNGNSTTFYWQIRMNKRMFIELHQLLVDEGGLTEGATSTVGTLESLGIFMRVLARGCRTRDLENRFQHSTETIHRYFTKVLDALCTIAPKLITPPDWGSIHPKILGDKAFHEFKDCVGALDGTHVNACVRACFKDRYRDRNGQITQNVLIACDFDGIINYVLPGWEGSAHDQAVLNYAVAKDKKNFPNPLKAPIKGKYFLVDSGYANKPGYLAPYRKIMYNLPDWERHIPSGRMEYFNKTHARLRNVIERVNRQLKVRCPLLTSRMYYGYSRRTQAKLVLAACVIHNFIKRRSFEYKWRDVIFDRSDEQLNVEAERHRGEMFRDDLPEEEYPNNIHNAMDEFRPNLTERIWGRRNW